MMDAFWITLIAVLISMTLLWLLSLRLRDASIVDMFWGPGFVLIAWIAFALSGNTSWRVWLIAIMVTIWGLRLGIYLFWRNHGKGEDPRYQAMRQHHGDSFWWMSLFIVYLLQGVLMWIVSWPIQLIHFLPQSPSLTWLDAVAVLLWLTGMFFETVGDGQLARFKADPINAGRVMSQGLWRYTRHPNYFGDFLVWWGFGLFVLNGGWAGMWALIGPFLMSVLLIKVSGVTLLEQRLHHTRPAYQDYVRRTSSFFPKPPRR
jgi:steroid 5-alpha reductase family enzyme